MSKSAFFVLLHFPKGQGEDARTDVLRADDTHTSDVAPKCSRCGNWIGFLEWLAPFRVEIHVWGQEAGDLAFGPYPSFLASAKFRIVYENNKLRGLRHFEDLEVIKVRSTPFKHVSLPRYYKADVAESTVAIDPVASGIEWSADPKLCPVCLQPTRKGVTLDRWKRVVIVPESWSGQDIFIPRGFQEYIVTDRFKSVCAAHSVKNAEFVPVEDYSGDLNRSRNVPPENLVRRTVEYRNGL